MADHRHPDAADDDQHPSADSGEPEFGSPEWLFRELGTEPEAAAGVDGYDAGVSGAGGAHAGEDADGAGSGTRSEDVAEPAAPPVSSFTWHLTPGAGSDPLVSGGAAEGVAAAEAAEAAKAVEPATAEVAGESGDASSERDEPEGSGTEPTRRSLREAEAEAAGAPERPSAAPAVPVPPGAAGVPAPTAAAEEPTAPAAGAQEPVVPAAPTGPSTTSAEPPSFLASLRMPKPPEWDEPATSAAPAASESVDDDADRSTDGDDDAAQPEEPQSHGLAALLGYGVPASDKPVSRSVIGDTTGIIPIIPGAVPPAGTPVVPPAPVVPSTPAATPAATPAPSAPTTPTAPATPPATTLPPATLPPATTEPGTTAAPGAPSTPAADAAPPSLTKPPAEPIASVTSASTTPIFAAPPAAPAVPPAFTHAPPPAEPVLPPPHTSQVFEPAVDGADVPTTKLDTAEIAALLAARVGDPDPLVPPVVSTAPVAAPEPSTVSAETVALPTTPTVSEETVALPTVPPIPAETAATAPDEPEVADADAEGQADTDETDDSEDGLAALFGDVAEPEDYVDDTPAADSIAAGSTGAEGIAAPSAEADSANATPSDGTDASAPTSDTPTSDTTTSDTPTTDTPSIDTILFGAPPTSDTVADEPGAALEGPQLTTPFTGPLTVPRETLPAPVFAADPTVAISSAAVPPIAPTGPVPTTPETPETPETPAASTTPGGGGDGPGSASTPPSRPRNPRNTRLLFIVAAALAVVLVLIGLFAIGTRLPSLFGAAQSAPKSSNSASASASATPTPTPTPTPTVTPKPGAPAAAGVQAWDALGGGECIDPYTTPWAESFTVVDCAAPHAAQMVYTGILNPDIAAPYPGADALGQQINGLCTAPGIIDLAAAGAYSGLQVQGTFPATEEQWKSGQRSYYCFANRSTGEPMTSSVAGPAA